MKKSLYFLLSLLLLLPFSTSAQSLTESSGLSAAAKNTDLIQGVTIYELITRIINGLLTFLGMLFTILIIYGGFKWMTSQGNSQQVDEAKNVIRNAVIGLTIVVFSYIIVYTVLWLLEGGAGQSGTPPADGSGGP